MSAAAATNAIAGERSDEVSPKPVPLSPMGFAGKAFAMVCEDIDGADTIDDRLKALFADTHEELQYRVDKRIAFDRWIKEQLGAAQEGLEFYAARIASINAAHERFKEQVKRDLEAAPGVEFRGKLGKVWLQPNPPSIEYTFGDKSITPEVAEMFEVPGEYIVERHIPARTEYVIDTAKLMSDLRANKEVTWASLKQGKHVRFPSKPRTPKAKVEAAAEAPQVEGAAS